MSNIGWKCGQDKCEGRTFRNHPTTGCMYCQSCGTIFNEENLVNESQFGESYNNSIKSSSNSHDFKYDKEIEAACTRLRWPLKYIEKVKRIFKMVCSMGYMRGRRAVNVIGACMLICSREEKFPVFLIEISEIISVNVFELGHTFVELVKLIHLEDSVKILDPIVHIAKHIHQLNLGDKKARIGITASEIVSRMKSDWLITGRNPKGICAAALQISMAVHGVELKNISSFTKIFRISYPTLRRRLDECSLMEIGGNLSEANKDPPSFMKGLKGSTKRKEVHHQELQISKRCKKEEEMEIKAKSNFASKLMDRYNQIVRYEEHEEDERFVDQYLLRDWEKVNKEKIWLSINRHYLNSKQSIETSKLNKSKNKEKPLNPMKSFKKMVKSFEIEALNPEPLETIFEPTLSKQKSKHFKVISKANKNVSNFVHDSNEESESDDLEEVNRKRFQEFDPYRSDYEDEDFMY